MSLTYDDGLSSQLENALLALDDHGFKGTFFLNKVASNPEPWRAARAAGHELAAHTLNHPCTEAFDWVIKESASEAYTARRMAEELDGQIRELRKLGQPLPHSFAYPCGTTWIGRDHESYVPLVRTRFTAARGVDGKILTEISDPMDIGAYFIEGPKEALIEKVREAIAKKGLVVFGFHGVGGDYLSVSRKDHLGFLRWLGDHRAEVTVLPFGEAVLCMESRAGV